MKLIKNNKNENAMQDIEFKSLVVKLDKQTNKNRNVEIKAIKKSQ